VAEDIKVVPPGSMKTVDYVVRDFRNFVHPKKEIRSALPYGENQAKLAFHALEVICDFCDKNP